jgi:site-specific DNA-methyltransferase (adenine-specific)
MRIKNGVWWRGDCLDVMKQLPDQSIDMILCDLPYGTTQNKWDTIIPFEPLWKQYWRITKSNAAIVLMASQPFTSSLIMSQIKYFKYDWIWEKSRPSGHMNAKRQPLRSHENVCVFYRKQCVYNPQMTLGKPNHINSTSKIKSNSTNYGKQYEVVEKLTDNKYPKTIQSFSVVSPTNIIHPTQKPDLLFEYLINTYTDEGHTVLDNCAGSGTTAIACENLNRKWICIENDDEYSNKAIDRINNI